MEFIKASTTMVLSPKEALELATNLLLAIQKVEQSKIKHVSETVSVIGFQHSEDLDSHSFTKVVRISVEKEE